jgi:hypothetical protein
MRVRQLMIAIVVVAMGCRQGSKSEEPVATPARSDKLIRVAEPVPGSYLVAESEGSGLTVKHVIGRNRGWKSYPPTSSSCRWRSGAVGGSGR